MFDQNKTETTVVKEWIIAYWRCKSVSRKTFPVNITIPERIPPTDTVTSKSIKISYFITVSVLLSPEINL